MITKYLQRITTKYLQTPTTVKYNYCITYHYRHVEIPVAKFFCTEIISRKLRKQVENSENGIKFERKNYKNDKMSKCEKSWKSKDEKTKIENMSKKCFWRNFEAKLFFEDEIWAFRAFQHTKTLKFRLSAICRCHNGLKSQTTMTFFAIFLYPDGPFEVTHG